MLADAPAAAAETATREAGPGTSCPEDCHYCSGPETD